MYRRIGAAGGTTASVVVVFPSPAGSRCLTYRRTACTTSAGTQRSAATLGHIRQTTKHFRACSATYQTLRSLLHCCCRCRDRRSPFGVATRERKQLPLKPCSAKPAAGVLPLALPRVHPAVPCTGSNAWCTHKPCQTGQPNRHRSFSVRASAPWKHWPKDHRLTGQPALSLHRRRDIAAAAAARRRQGLAACRPRHVCLTLPAHTVREPSIASPRAHPTGARETPMRAGPRLAGHRRCFFHSGDPKVVWSLRSLVFNRGELTVEACYCHAFLREDAAQLCRRPCCQAWALIQATCSDLLHALRLRFSSSTAPPATYLCERAASCSPPRRRFFQPGTPPSGRRPQRDVSRHGKYSCSGSRPRGLHFDRYRGVRVGEASTPGPPRLHDQEERALDALARVGIGPAHNGGVPHVASESFFDCEQPDNLVRSADDQSDHTAPGMTPPPSEDDTPGAADRQAVCEATLLDTPPETARSWLYVPLLLHAAGRLTDHAAQVWLAHPSGGARWRRAAESLAATPPVALSELVWSR